MVLFCRVIGRESLNRFFWPLWEKSDYYLIIYIGILGLAWDCPLTVMLGWTEAVWYERFCPTPLVHGQLTSSPGTLKLIDLYRCTNGCTEVDPWRCWAKPLCYIASVHPNITVNGQSHANIGVGLSINSDVRVDRGSMVWEVLPYTIGAWSINQFPKNTEVNWSVQVHQWLHGSGSVEVLGKTSLTISPLSSLISLSMDSPVHWQWC